MTGRDRLIEIEQTVATEARTSPGLVAALTTLARHELHYASDKTMAQRESDKRDDSDYWRGYYAANKKLIKRLSKEPENDR